MARCTKARKTNFLAFKATNDEAERIAAKIAATGLSKSQYLLAAALQVRLLSRVDQNALAELRRLGGLLKLAIRERGDDIEIRKRLTDTLYAIKEQARKLQAEKL